MREDREWADEVRGVRVGSARCKRECRTRNPAGFPGSDEGVGGSGGDSEQYAVNGIRIERGEGGVCRAITTDGRRLTLAEWTDEHTAPDFPPITGPEPGQFGDGAVIGRRQWEEASKAIPKNGVARHKPVLNNCHLDEGAVIAHNAAKASNGDQTCPIRMTATDLDHERLWTPEDAPGALTFFHATPREHYGLVRQLTAEKQVQETKAGRDIIRWERIRRNNHFLDCAYLASAAAHFCGVRLLGAQRQTAMVTDYFSRQRDRRLTTHDGRPFLITERAV